MSIAKYNGTCYCGAPIRKGRTDIRMVNRKAACAHHVLDRTDETGEPCDAWRDGHLERGTWQGWSNTPR